MLAYSFSYSCHIHCHTYTTPFLHIFILIYGYSPHNKIQDSPKVKVDKSKSVLFVKKLRGDIEWQHSLEAMNTSLLEFYKTQGTIGFPVRIALLINIPKGFSSKMTLEVAKIGLKVSTQYML